ncbi:hypothetical protein [Streptomyces fradiae]|uniref:hypothetical protein n=1 Tax=Streptomyces fradiae TaxID=1906 RepID=UPI003985E6E1
MATTDTRYEVAEITAASTAWDEDDPRGRGQQASGVAGATRRYARGEGAGQVHLELTKPFIMGAALIARAALRPAKAGRRRVDSAVVQLIKFAFYIASRRQYR